MMSGLSPGSAGANTRARGGTSSASARASLPFDATITPRPSARRTASMSGRPSVLASSTITEPAETPAGLQRPRHELVRQPVAALGSPAVEQPFGFSQRVTGDLMKG